MELWLNIINQDLFWLVQTGSDQKPVKKQDLDLLKIWGLT